MRGSCRTGYFGILSPRRIQPERSSSRTLLLRTRLLKNLYENLLRSFSPLVPTLPFSGSFFHLSESVSERLSIRRPSSPHIPDKTVRSLDSESLGTSVVGNLFEWGSSTFKGTVKVESPTRTVPPSSWDSNTFFFRGSSVVRVFLPCFLSSLLTRYVSVIDDIPRFLL